LRLREVAIAKSCQFPQHRQTAEPPIQQGSQAIQRPFSPTLFREDPI
jgi:hypothetical protein